MLQPDIETLRLCSTVASLSFGLVFGWLWASRRSDSYMLYWAASALLYSAVLIGFDSLDEKSRIVHGGLLCLLALSSLLLLSGVFRFDGQRTVRSWMVFILIPPVLGDALPGMVDSLGGLQNSHSLSNIGASAGLACTTGAIGLILLLGKSEFANRGRRMAGMAILGYLPSYGLAIAAELQAVPLHKLVWILPLLSDQILLGLLNLGLLAMPAERAQERLRQLALRDPLTGAWNRTGFEAQAARLFSPEATVLAMDVDHFKSINDAYGHATGDRILMTFAQGAIELVGAQGGVVGRVGGDEFVAVLPARSASPRLLAERLRSLADGHDPLPRWSISIGLSAVEPADKTVHAALQRADESLYRAKRLGRNRVAA
jgi:diguanylate cyclase (GGDEF)-like protein